MLSAIRKIGKWWKDKSEKDRSDTFIPTDKLKNSKIIFININTEKKEFKGIELEDFESNKISRYLFKQGSSKGNKPSPIAQITEPKKTLKKIITWLKNCLEIDEDANNTIFIRTIKDILLNNEDGVIQRTKEKTWENKSLPKDKRDTLFLSIKINNKYVGDFDFLVRLINEFEKKKNLEVSATNKRCSVCGKEKTRVYGNMSDIFKFSTIDKPGFIAGGFYESIAWKNYPLCLDCKSELESGKNFMYSKLSQRFVYGLDYILVPKLLIGKSETLDEILSIFSDANKLISLKEKVKKRITNDENEVLDIIKDENDVLTLNFLFMERKSGSSSAEKILHLIEDIFPSRIRKIFDEKDNVDKIVNDNFNFGKIREFFSKSDVGKKNYDLDKYFLEIVDKVFRGIKIDFSFLTRFFMMRIRNKFINDDYYNIAIKNAIMCTLFFENLGLIKFEEVKDMEENIFDPVFTKFSKSLTNPIKRGLFLLGGLIQLLFNKQWADRNAKPFMKYLKGLKMDEKDIKALLPKVQNKLEEYGSFDKGKRIIAQECSRFFLESQDNWKMSVDEINFYFCCGMNLVDEIATIVYPNGNIEKREG